MAPSAVRRGLRPAGCPGLLPLLGCGGLLLSAGFSIGAARAGEIQATAGALGLGSLVNGIPGGSCSQGNCAISGGTAAGSNLFHRFSSFDSRGAITGVSIAAQGFRNVVLGVIHPLGTFLDKPLQLSGGADLIWLSPGGIQLSGAYGFTGMGQLSLSTASGLQLGEGRFDALRTPAGQAAGLSGQPLAAAAGLRSDPASLQAIGLSRNGDLSLAGGLLTVDSNLLLDAQAGGVQLQAARIQATSIAVQGQNVAQNASLTAVGPAASVQVTAAGNLLASAPIRAVSSAAGNGGGNDGDRGGAILLRAGGNLIQTEASQLQAAGQVGGGSIVVQAGAQLFSSGRYDARGLAASARGGEIELSGPSLLLRSARAEATGGAAGGAVRIGAGWQGAALHHGGSRALSIDINAGTTLTADAQGQGHGGEVVVWSDGQARFAGSASARGGSGGGDGGAIEVSGKGTLQFSGRADAGATTGRAGRLLLDPQTLIIDAQAPASGTAYGTVTLADPNPGSLQAFASTVAALANGDIVATDPDDDLLAPRGGAVYQFRPDGALVATLYGQSAFDRVGRNGITLLSNGNYVVSSSSWNLPGGAAAVGAATWRSADSRDSVAVSPANSLVGSSADDNVSSGGIRALAQGNYVVISPLWDLRDSNGGLSAADAGAVTWGNGSSGASVGAVSSANSRTGSTAQDSVGSGGVTALSDGHYVIASPLWNLTDSSGNLLAAQTGAATWATGSAGSSGPIAASNSLIGGQSNDRAASGGVIDLGNSNYVVLSPGWNLLDPALTPQLVPAAGAATLAPGAGPYAAKISPTNSLTGSRSNDQVGSLAVALTTSDFVVGSPRWDGFDALNNPISDAGAATFSSGLFGSATVGAVSSSNSLVGFSAGDLVSSGGLIALRDGGYVVSSPEWNRSEGSIAPLMPQAGAASFGPAGRGVQGGIHAGNSLIGGRAGDRISSGGVVALNPGGYVVSSPLWDRIDPQRGTLLAIDAGAASHGDGTTGVVGLVDPFRHSLVGSLDNDLVSSGGITALSGGGRHVVASPSWNLADGAGNLLFAAAGAATWVDPGLGRSPALPGVVSPQNSLVGSGSGHSIASGGVVALRDGHYVVSSPLFDLSDPAGQRLDVGAATWGNGAVGSSGFVSATNSLIGGSPNDSVSSGGVFALSQGLFLVSSPNWDLPATQTAAAVPDAGAASVGNASLAGPVALSNSLTGRSSGERYSAAAAATPAVISSGDAFLINTNTNNANSSTGSLGHSGLLQLGRAYPYSPSDPLLAGFGPGAGRIDAGDYGGAAITISPQTIAAIAASGTPVFLQASGDLFLNPGATIDLASSSIPPGSLTLEAGRTLRLDAGIFSRGSDIRLRANQITASSPGDRPPGAGELLVQPGVQLDARGSGGDGQLELTVGPARTDGSQPAGALRLQGATLQAADIRLSGSLAVEIEASQLNARQTLTISNTPGNAEVATGTAGVSIRASQLQADSLLAIGGSPARSSTVTGSAAGVSITDGTQITLLGPTATLSIEGKGGRGVSAPGIEILASRLQLAAASSSSTAGISLSGLGGRAGSDSSFLAGILLGQGTLLESGAGSINLTGSGGGSSLPDTSQSFHGGIQLTDAVLSSGSGNILITARGGQASQGRVDGLQLLAASGPTPTQISSGSGSITIDAVAGNSDSGSGRGARIGEGPGAGGGGARLQTSGGGAIRISAAGNQRASATGSGNVGLLLGDQASILGTGAIELLGSGGFGVNDNHGITAAAGSQIRSQAPSAAAAADPLWLRGLRGSASGSNNHGLQLLGTISREASGTDPANPALLLEGLGSSQSAAAAFAGDSNNIGVFLAGAISSSAADSSVVIRGEADGLGSSSPSAGGNTGVWIDRTATLLIGAIPTAGATSEPQSVLAISGSGSPRSGGQDNRGLHLAGSLSVAGGLQIRATGGSGRDGNRGFQQASGSTIELLGHLPTTGGYSGLALDIDAGSGQTSGDGNQALLLQGQTDIRSSRASLIQGRVTAGGQNDNSGIELSAEGLIAPAISSQGLLSLRGFGSGQGAGNHGLLSSASITSAGLAIEASGGGGTDSNGGIVAFQLDPLSSSSAPLWQISTPAGADALTLLGRGAGSGNDNVGVQLAAAVQVSGGGRTSITGSGGSGVAGNSGVILANPLTGLSSRPVPRGFRSDGPIRIDGSRGDASGSGNLGVAIRTPLSSSAPASAGTASLSVSGGDGATPPGRTPTNDNVGLLIETGGSVSAAADSAAIELTGVGRGSGSGNHGIVVSGEGLDSSGQPIPIWAVEGNGSGTAIRLNGSAPATGTDQAVRLQGTALTASGGSAVTIQSSGAPITLPDGRIRIDRPGTLQISGAPFTWLGGTLAGDGDITSSAGVLLPGGGERWLAGPSLTLNNATLEAGLLRLTSGRLDLTGRFASLAGSALQVDGGAELRSEASANLAGRFDVARGGRVTIRGGDFGLHGSGSDSGALYLVEAGATDSRLIWNSDRLLLGDNSYQSANGGLYELAGGTLLSPASLRFGGDLLLSGGTIRAGDAVVVTPVGPSQPGDPSPGGLPPGGPGPGSATGDPLIRDEGGGSTPVLSVAASFELSGAYTQTGGSISGFSSIGIASPGPLTISGGSLRSAPGGSIRVASRSTDPQTGVRISQADLDSSSGNGNGGLIAIDAASIRLNGSRLRSSGALSGGIINIGVSPDAPSGPPATLSIQQSNLIAESVAIAGQINIYGQNIEVIGSNLQLNGAEAGALTAGGAGAGSLLLDRDSEIRLSYNAPLALSVAPGGSLINNARILRSGTPPPPQPACRGSSCPPGSGSGSERLRGVPGVAAALDQSLAQSPLHTQPRLSSPGAPAPAPQPERPGSDRRPAPRLEISTASFTPTSMAAITPDRLPGLPGAATLPAGPVLQGPIETLSGEPLRRRFDAETAAVQEETARRLGLAAEELAVPPTLEELQQFLGRITQWMRSQERNGSCSGGQGPCP